MKALEWRKYLDEQHRLHGKALFTMTELANVAGASRNVLNVELMRLRRRGVIVKYAHGLYGLPDVVPLEALVRAIDSRAYVTGLYALHVHSLITQIPSRITCFTDRHSPRGRERATPLGRLVFVCVRSRVFNPPEDGAVAGPEAAFCDFVYLSRRQGVVPESHVTFRGRDNLDAHVLHTLLERYPAAVRKHVLRLVRCDPGRRSEADGSGFKDSDKAGVLISQRRRLHRPSEAPPFLTKF